MNGAVPGPFLHPTNESGGGSVSMKKEEIEIATMDRNNLVEMIITSDFSTYNTNKQLQLIVNLAMFNKDEYKADELDEVIKYICKKTKIELSLSLVPKLLTIVSKYGSLSDISELFERSTLSPILFHEKMCLDEIFESLSTKQDSKEMLEFLKSILVVHGYRHYWNNPNIQKLIEFRAVQLKGE